jgi:hypothetical protein
MQLRYSKLTEKQTAGLCEQFLAGPARSAAEFVGGNTHTAALAAREAGKL